MIDTSDEHIRELAAEILARARYARWRPSMALDGLDRLLRWLESVAAWLRQLSDAQPLLYLLIVATLLALGALSVAHIVYTVRRALTVPDPGPSSPFSPPQHSFSVEAASLAAAGRFLDAAQRLQLAVIELLLRRRVVELGRSEPNRTLRQRLRHATLAGADRQQLLHLLDRLEKQWFRDRGDDAELYESWRRLHNRLQGHGGGG